VKAIIKDILAFANAFRSTEAYIIIGAEDVKGGRAIIAGISHHPNDADLQQLVNTKTGGCCSSRYRFSSGFEGDPLASCTSTQDQALFLAMRAKMKPNIAAPHAAPPPDSPTTSTILTFWEK
jgi:hypothetical protein